MDIDWILIGTALVIGLAIVLLFNRKLQKSEHSGCIQKGAPGPLRERGQKLDGEKEVISISPFGTEGQKGGPEPPNLDGRGGKEGLHGDRGSLGEVKRFPGASGERAREEEEENEGKCMSPDWPEGKVVDPVPADIDGRFDEEGLQGAKERPDECGNPSQGEKGAAGPSGERYQKEEKENEGTPMGSDGPEGQMGDHEPPDPDRRDAKEDLQGDRGRPSENGDFFSGDRKRARRAPGQRDQNNEEEKEEISLCQGGPEVVDQVVNPRQTDLDRTDSQEGLQGDQGRSGGNGETFPYKEKDGGRKGEEENKGISISQDGPEGQMDDFGLPDPDTRDCEEGLQEDQGHPDENVDHISGEGKGSKGPLEARVKRGEEENEGLSIGQDCAEGPKGNSGPPDLDARAAEEVTQEDHGHPGENANHLLGVEKGTTGPQGEGDRKGEGNIEGISICRDGPEGNGVNPETPNLDRRGSKGILQGDQGRTTENVEIFSREEKQEAPELEREKGPKGKEEDEEISICRDVAEGQMGNPLQPDRDETADEKRLKEDQECSGENDNPFSGDERGASGPRGDSSGNGEEANEEIFIGQDVTEGHMAGPPDLDEDNGEADVKWDQELNGEIGDHISDEKKEKPKELSFEVRTSEEPSTDGKGILSTFYKITVGKFIRARNPPLRLNLKIVNVTCSNVTLTWDRPTSSTSGTSVDRFKVNYKPLLDKYSDQYFTAETEEPACLCTIYKLNPSTSYRFWVSIDVPGPFSGLRSETIDIKTPSREKEIFCQRRISSFLKICRKLQKGNPSIYAIPLAQGTGKRGVYHTYHFGRSNLARKRHIVIMVVGATGAGKSTLINGMVNYILNVKWGDHFRFKIVSERLENKSRGQSESQTQTIVSYTIHPKTGMNLKYPITIIDTPGFGDTRGIKRDQMIFDQVRTFFKNCKSHHIDQIDAIGFVAQSSQARLTHSQRYVFDSILAIFGQDVKDNILLLITFADGQRPPVLDAIEAAKIPVKLNDFKFNNSALFARNLKQVQEDGDPERLGSISFDEMFWRMGVQSMANFFKALLKLKPVSLTLTKEVLEERNCLQVSLDGLQPQIKAGLGKLEELKTEHDILEQHESEIEANKNYEYEIKVQKPIRVDIPRGEFITNCGSCHVTCHYPCRIPDDKDKDRCWAMTNGKCTICPDKCVWNLHYNTGYKFDIEEVTENRTYAELEERYKDATGKKLSIEQVMEKNHKEFLAVQVCVKKLITVSHKSLKRLHEIALRPNPLSTVNYIDLLIESEKNECKPGWDGRVKALMNVRQEAEFLGKLEDPEYDPFEKYNKEFLEKGKGKKSGKCCIS